MALNQNPPGRPDFGAREPGTGKPIHRRGAEAAESDIDIATTSNFHDLIGDGDFESGQRDTGGAEALAGEITSDDGNAFTVTVDWLDDDGNVLATHDPSSLDTVTDVAFNIIIRSDHFEVKITDESSAGQNNIHGTANAH